MRNSTHTRETRFETSDSKLDYGRPAAPPPPDKLALRTGVLSLLCLGPFLAFVALWGVFHVSAPPEYWKYFFISSLAGVFAGMICVDRANGRLARGWLGLIFNTAVAVLFTFAALLHG